MNEKEPKEIVVDCIVKFKSDDVYMNLFRVIKIDEENTNYIHIRFVHPNRDLCHKVPRAALQYMGANFTDYQKNYSITRP